MTQAQETVRVAEGQGVEGNGVAVEADGVGQGIAPIVGFLKENGVKVYYFTEAYDEVFHLPMIWFDGDEDEGLRAVDVITDFADQRGYELLAVQREWGFFRSCPWPKQAITCGEQKSNYILEEPPYWIIVFCLPKNLSIDAPTIVSPT